MTCGPYIRSAIRDPSKRRSSDTQDAGIQLMASLGRQKRFSGVDAGHVGTGGSSFNSMSAEGGPSLKYLSTGLGFGGELQTGTSNLTVGLALLDEE